jgi:hypothetical protein
MGSIDKNEVRKTKWRQHVGGVGPGLLVKRYVCQSAYKMDVTIDDMTMIKLFESQIQGWNYS